MRNSYFQFRQFFIHQDKCAMKVTTDACLFGAWVASDVETLFKSDCDKNPLSVLDIGAGTGLLSLMFAQKHPSSTIDAIEIDKDAASQAMENIAASPLASSVHVQNADIRTFLFSKKYDIVISNPPFYENEIKAESETHNLARHQSGLTIEQLLGILKRILSPSGAFYLLLPFKRHQAIMKMLAKESLFASKTIFVRPSIRHPNFRLMLKGMLAQETRPEAVTNEISIWNGQQKYSDVFVNLLKDYYLNLQYDSRQ